MYLLTQMVLVLFEDCVLVIDVLEDVVVVFDVRESSVVVGDVIGDSVVVVAVIEDAVLLTAKSCEKLSARRSLRSCCSSASLSSLKPKSCEKPSDARSSAAVASSLPRSRTRACAARSACCAASSSEAPWIQGPGAAPPASRSRGPRRRLGARPGRTGAPSLQLALPQVSHVPQRPSPRRRRAKRTALGGGPRCAPLRSPAPAPRPASPSARRDAHAARRHSVR